MVEAELLRAVRDLHRAMGRLTGFLAGSLCCLVSLGLWARWRGVSPLWLVAAGFWLSARRHISRWTWAVDARLGKGSGRALLELGIFQEGAFVLVKGRQALALGEKPGKG